MSYLLFLWRWAGRARPTVFRGLTSWLCGAWTVCRWRTSRWGTVAHAVTSRTAWTRAAPQRERTTGRATGAGDAAQLREDGDTTTSCTTESSRRQLRRPRWPATMTTTELRSGDDGNGIGGDGNDGRQSDDGRLKPRRRRSFRDVATAHRPITRSRGKEGDTWTK